MHAFPYHVALNTHTETLDRSEAIVDSNRYMIEKSARTLRGMSWWGSVKNYFSEEPAAPRPRTAAWMTRPEAQAATGAAAAAAAAPVESSGPARGQWAEQREAPAGGDDRRELFMRRPGSGGPADEARAARGRQAPSVSDQEERQCFNDMHAHTTTDRVPPHT